MQVGVGLWDAQRRRAHGECRDGGRGMGVGCGDGQWTAIIDSLYEGSPRQWAVIAGWVMEKWHVFFDAPAVLWNRAFGGSSGTLTVDLWHPAVH